MYGVLKHAVVVLSNRSLENLYRDLTRMHDLDNAHPCIVSVTPISTFQFEIRREVVKTAERP